MFKAAISISLYNFPIIWSSFGVGVKLHIIDAAHTIPVTTETKLKMKSIIYP
tara:strand:+ start:299 stop:454 length:156 start_codon:yes stop_codon:yes gene_type:complete